MTRSLGDALAKTCGVIPTPEVSKELLDLSLRFIVLASDGVWEVLESKDVVKIVANFLPEKNPTSAVQALADEASKHWAIVHSSEFPELYR